jgi:predicted acyltransferase
MKHWFFNYSNSILEALPRNRLLALDVFRGLTIAAMVLVNNPGSWSFVYEPLLHAKWHGYTPTDLIFPFFVFIVGISIAIVLGRTEGSSRNHIQLIKTAAVRASKLIMLGLFLALFYYQFNQDDYSWLDTQLYQIRLPGVLQRLGLVFFLTFLLVLFAKKKHHLIWTCGLLLGYWLALAGIPYGGGFVGLYEHGNSLVAWVDDYVFGTSHVYYREATPYAFDPEGLLSTLPAVASALTGVMTGYLLTNPTIELSDKIKTMMKYAVISLLLGYLWSIVFPINKALWTSSYVLVTTGWALAVLAVLLWLIDLKGYKNWSAPFVVFGANAIFFYMFSAILARLLIMTPVDDSSLHGWFYGQVLQPIFGNYNGSLAFALLFLIVSYVVMHWLYKKQIFFKV